jgi:hypothetical protein
MFQGKESYCEPKTGFLEPSGLDLLLKGLDGDKHILINYLLDYIK